MNERDYDNLWRPTLAVRFDTPVQAGPARAAGEILVQFGPGVGAEAREAALAHVGGRIADIVRGGPDDAGGMLARVVLGQGLDVDEAIAILSRRPGVTFAEPNFTYFIEATSNDSAYVGGQLWGMYGDQTSPANNFGSQAGEAWAAGHTGSMKVVIGVIDSGVDYTHPDLYLNIWLNPNEIPATFRSALQDSDSDGFITFRDLNASLNAAFVSDLNGNGYIDGGDLLADSRWENGVDDDANGYRDDLIGWDFVNNDNDPYDDNNHGTHVAGTIAGVGGNGTGVAGVAWAAQIMALKFLSATGSGSTSNAVRAIDYYTAAANASTGLDFAATNNSWGGGGYSQALLDAIVRGGRADALFVAAAGNGGSDSRGDDNDNLPHYPSSYDTTASLGWNAIISVASITSSGGRSSFSNYGDVSVDLGAPGSSIYSTLPGGGYGSFSGTSMATPHVTGAIALYSSLSSESAAQIFANLMDSAAPTASLSGYTVSGGRLDVSAFIGEIGVAPPPSPEPDPVPTRTLLSGTTASDTIIGSPGDEMFYGVPSTGTHLGKGTIDTLVGGGGSDLFVLGDARGVFYNDGRGKTAGTGDYALIRGFDADDFLQLAGAASDYYQNVQGGNLAVYFDSNGNGRFDSRDELVAMLEGVTQPLGNEQFIFV